MQAPLSSGRFISGAVHSYGVVELDSLCVVTLMGELNAKLAPRLRRFLMHYAAVGQHMVVCLQEVTRMDSASAGILRKIHLRMQRLGYRLIIVGANHAVERTIEQFLPSGLLVCRDLSEVRYTVFHSKLSS